jgi:hypothetical protein
MDTYQVGTGKNTTTFTRLMVDLAAPAELEFGIYHVSVCRSSARS